MVRLFPSQPLRGTIMKLGFTPDCRMEDIVILSIAILLALLLQSLPNVQPRTIVATKEHPPMVQRILQTGLGIVMVPMAAQLSPVRKPFLLRQTSPLLVLPPAL